MTTTNYHYSKLKSRDIDFYGKEPSHKDHYLDTVVGLIKWSIHHASIYREWGVVFPSPLIDSIGFDITFTHEETLDEFEEELVIKEEDGWEIEYNQPEKWDTHFFPKSVEVDFDKKIATVQY